MPLRRWLAPEQHRNRLNLHCGAELLLKTRRPGACSAAGAKPRTLLCAVGNFATQLCRGLARAMCDADPCMPRTVLASFGLVFAFFCFEVSSRHQSSPVVAEHLDIVCCIRLHRVAHSLAT